MIHSKLFSQAASKWMKIGRYLEIRPIYLDRIGCDSQWAGFALLDVFMFWSATKCSPYSWKTILNVLKAVGHRRLANDIARRLSGEMRDCMCIVLCLTSPLIQCVVCNPVLWDHAAIVMDVNHF